MEESKVQKLETKKYEKGEMILQKGTPITQAAVVMSGVVSAKYGNLVLDFQPGSVLGLFGVQIGTFCMDYKALEEVTVCLFDFNKVQDIKQVFRQGKNYKQIIMSDTVKEIDKLIHTFNMEQVLIDQSCKYIKKQYANYQELCSRIGCVPKVNNKIDRIEAFLWELGENEELVKYFSDFARLPKEVQQDYFAGGDMLAIRYLQDVARVAKPLMQGCELQLTSLLEALVLLCGDDDVNIFALYSALLKEPKTPKKFIPEILEALKKIVDLHEKIQMTITHKLYLQIEQTNKRYRMLYDSIMLSYQNLHEDENGKSGEVREAIDVLDITTNVLEKILDYSGLDREFRLDFKEFLEKYRNMRDRTSMEKEDRAVRKKLTEMFYDLYTAVFFRAEKEKNNSRCLRLFLEYGIVDETLFKQETIDTLAFHSIHSAKELPIHVYTMRQWLHEIYIGNKEPSKNEFDQGFDEYLREKNKGKMISDVEKAKENAPESKVMFEIKNFFQMNNRLISGRLLSFCPVLTEEDLNENLTSQLLTAQSINQAFRNVLDIDFSVFYRDVMYDDRKNGITNLIIHKEVLPDVICLPNAGTLGRMWQEISGKKRATPGRFTLPILMKESLNKNVVRMIGSFRWEICKRVQGNYWNDVSEPSLTSEFCDYLQFYKRNRDLSEKGKERLAQLLVKCRSNYGEVFATDYVMWILSESGGNVRLDKVARNILGRYCPFVKDIRKKLLEQPIFTDAVNRYEKERKKHLKELSNRRVAIRNNNGTETEEFLREFDFYEL